MSDLECVQGIRAISFSPVGGTETIVNALAENLGKALGIPVKKTSFTLPEKREMPLVCSPEELVVFGTPVYAGRVPNLLLPFLSTIQGNGAWVIPVVVFGNRNYDDALLELGRILQNTHAQVIAGGAFVSQHAFSNVLGAGRPNEEDCAQLQVFATAIVHKCQAKDKTKPIFLEDERKLVYFTPRDRHGTFIDIRKVTPKVGDTCNQCGLCAQRCPLGSINPENVREMTGACMKCCACEKHCPQGARYFDDPGYIYHREELEALYEKHAPVFWQV